MAQNNQNRNGTLYDRDKRQRQRLATKTSRKPKSQKILVGIPWPEGIEVYVEQPHHEIRDYVVVGLAILFGVLFASFVAYAMIITDVGLLKQAFGIVQYGLVVIAMWAIGKKVLAFFGRFSHVKD